MSKAPLAGVVIRCAYSQSHNSFSYMNHCLTDSSTCEASYTEMIWTPKSRAAVDHPNSQRYPLYSQKYQHFSIFRQYFVVFVSFALNLL